MVPASNALSARAFVIKPIGPVLRFEIQAIEREAAIDNLTRRFLEIVQRANRRWPLRRFSANSNLSHEF